MKMEPEGWKYDGQLEADGEVKTNLLPPQMPLNPLSSSSSLLSASCPQPSA